MQFQHHFREQFAGFRIGQTPTPAAGFKEGGILRRKIQRGVFIRAVAGHGGVTVQVQLRDHGDAEGVGKCDQTLELGAGDHFFFPAYERSALKGEHTPGFQHNVIVLVIGGKTDHFFDLECPCFGEPADVDPAECHVRRVHDLCGRDDEF